MDGVKCSHKIPEGSPQWLAMCFLRMCMTFAFLTLCISNSRLYPDFQS
jgi:hypothetical protein